MFQLGYRAAVENAQLKCEKWCFWAREVEAQPGEPFFRVVLGAAKAEY